MRKIKVIYGVEYEWTTKGNITYWFPIKKYNKYKGERNDNR